MMAEAFMNRPGNYPMQQYSHSHFAPSQNVASYPQHDYYGERDYYGRGRSRSHSKRRRREYSDSDDSYSSAERGRKRRHRKKRSHSKSPVSNNDSIIALD